MSNSRINDSSTSIIKLPQHFLDSPQTIYYLYNDLLNMPATTRPLYLDLKTNLFYFKILEGENIYHAIRNLKLYFQDTKLGIDLRVDVRINSTAKLLYLLHNDQFPKLSHQSMYEKLNEKFGNIINEPLSCHLYETIIPTSAFTRNNIQKSQSLMNTNQLYSPYQSEENVASLDEAAAFTTSPNQEWNYYSTQNTGLPTQAFANKDSQQNQLLINRPPIYSVLQGEENITSPDESAIYFTDLAAQELSDDITQTFANNDLQQNQLLINTSQICSTLQGEENITSPDETAAFATCPNQEGSNYLIQNTDISISTPLSNAIKQGFSLINTPPIYSAPQSEENIASPEETAVYFTDMQQSQPKVNRKNSIESRILYQDPTTKLLYLKPREHEIVSSVRANLAKYFKKNKIGNDLLTCNSYYRVIFVTSNDQIIHNLIKETFGGKINNEPLSVDVYKHFINSNRYSKEIQTFFTNAMRNVIQRGQPLINTTPISLGHQGEEYIAYRDVSEPFATYPNQEENYNSTLTLPNNDIQQNPSLINTNQEPNNIVYTDASASSTTYISQEWNNDSIQNNTTLPQTFISNDVQQSQPLINTVSTSLTPQSEENIASPDESAIYFTDLDAQESSDAITQTFANNDLQQNQLLINTPPIYSAPQSEENIASPNEPAVYFTDIQQSQPKANRLHPIASRTLYQDPHTKLLYFKPEKDKDFFSTQGTLASYFKNNQIGNSLLTSNSYHEVICVASDDELIHNMIKEKFGGKVTNTPLSVDVYKSFIHHRYSKKIQTFFINAMRNVIPQGQPLINKPPIYLSPQDKKNIVFVDKSSSLFSTYPNANNGSQNKQSAVIKQMPVNRRPLFQDPNTTLLYFKPREDESIQSARENLLQYFDKHNIRAYLNVDEEYKVILVTCDNETTLEKIKKNILGNFKNKSLLPDYYTRHNIPRETSYSNAIKQGLAMKNTIPTSSTPQGEENVTSLDESVSFSIYPDQRCNDYFTQNTNTPTQAFPSDDIQQNTALINTTQIYSTPQSENNIISNDVYESFVPHINQEENNYSIQNHAFSTQAFPRNDVSQDQPLMNNTMPIYSAPQWEENTTYPNESTEFFTGPTQECNNYPTQNNDICTQVLPINNIPQHQPLMNKNQICSTYQDEENIASPNESALYFTDLEAQESGTELLNHSSLLGDHFDFSNPLSDNSISINAISSNSMTLFGNNGNAIKKRASEDNSNINSPPLKAARTHITPSSY